MTKPFLITLAKMLLALVLLFFILKIWLSFTTNHGQKIAVPNLKSMSLLKLKDVLAEKDLLYKIQDTASFNPKYPPLSVIEQNPEFGEFVKENRKIYITLNPSGYRKIKLPDLMGKTKRQVEMHLKSIGFEIGTFSFVPDRGRNVVRGLSFKGKRIHPGDMIPKKSKINLILGDGKL
ncbi:MAG: PASTA domain-containing protein [Flavobacteriaceae bacterium]